MNKSLPPCRFFMVERTVSTERKEAAKKIEAVGDSMMNMGRWPGTQLCCKMHLHEGVMCFVQNKD